MKKEKKIKNEIIKRIEMSKSAIILTHTNPDGDAIGSAIALKDYLTFKGVSSKIFINSNIPDNLVFLDDDREVFEFDEKTHFHDFQIADLILIVDLNDSSRLKSMEIAMLKSKAYKMIIDHHVEPKSFADLFLVDTEASSTGELIWQLVSTDKSYKLSRKAANGLYVAIMTDTGSFRFPRTDAEVHKIVANLIAAGADPVRMYDEVYNRTSFEALKLLGEGFAGLERYFDGRLVVMTLTKGLFDKTGAKEEDVENFVERLLSIKGTEVGLLISEDAKRNELRISLRSKGNISVRDIAGKYGGGGHLNASGARVPEINSLERTKTALINDIEKYLI